MEDIHNFLARHDTHRCGYPQRPLPFPLVQDYDLELHNSINSLWSHIVQILSDNAINHSEPYHATTQWRRVESVIHTTSARGTLTIHTTDDSNISSWFKAATEISELISREDIRDIQVEIVNPQKTYHQSLAYETLASSDVVASFQDMKDRFVAFADLYMEDQWITLGPGMCMNDAEELVPAVYFLVEEHGKCAWEKAIDEFNRLFKNLSFAIRLQPGRLAPLGGSQDGDLANQASICTKENPDSCNSRLLRHHQGLGRNSLSLRIKRG